MRSEQPCWIDFTSSGITMYLNKYLCPSTYEAGSNIKNRVSQSTKNIFKKTCFKYLTTQQKVSLSSNRLLNITLSPRHEC